LLSTLSRVIPPTASCYTISRRQIPNPLAPVKTLNPKTPNPKSLNPYSLTLNPLPLILNPKP